MTYGTLGRLRALSLCGALAALALITACKGMLDVSNPAAITEENLAADDQTLIFMERGIQNGVRGEYPWMAAMGAAFTDEAISGHGWQPWNAYDQRRVTPDNGAHAGFTYGLLYAGKQQDAEQARRGVRELVG